MLLQRDEGTRAEQGRQPLVVLEVPVAVGGAELARGRHPGQGAGQGVHLGVELAGVDAYEAEYEYERVAATLASGRRAWVYVHALHQA